jgi:hypothetical protein
VNVFNDASDNSRETKKEINELPDEVVDSDGADELPDEIGLEDSEKTDKSIDNSGVGENENKAGESVENTESKNTNESDEPEAKKGGSYRDVKRTSDGDTYEVHHMPADSASNLERDDGPAIRMEKEDHRQTASCGNSREAREYRERQKELIEQGKFREALQMDIDDIHEKFGDKYDDAIAEMQEYVDKLEQEGKING